MTIEAKRILDFLASAPNGNSTAKKKVAQELLLRNPIFCRGELVNIVAKSMGCGIYKLFTVPV